LTEALMTACWAQEANCADPDTLSRIAESVGWDASKSRLPEVQAREIYDRYTKEAIDAQVFGAPTYVVDRELFWGQDRLELLERKLSA
ncbi:MAG: 2-hydroxychromene-2-carboxylate isomerase, partial [Proteobacteria bacterium]